MGYDVVNIERFGQNSIRILLDHRFDSAIYLATPENESYIVPLIQIDDCEKVSKQLTHVLEVENIDYERLEISSAGVNRPLVNWIDCVRYEGELAKIELKMMIIERNQKRFQGRICFLAEEKEKFVEYFQLSTEKQNELAFCMLLTKDGIEHTDGSIRTQLARC
jgi:ribosome maturation factor RimP